MFLYFEDETKNVVVFYVGYSVTYFLLLWVLLLWTKGIYIVGKYSFQSFLLFIVIAEIVKWILANIYCQKIDYNLPKKHKSISNGNSQRIYSRTKIKDIGKSLFVVGIMTAVYFLIAILFGAEITSKHEETLMFSILLSVLTIFPVCLNMGTSGVLSVLLGVRSPNQLETLLSQNLYFTAAGAWLGAIAIPLDWDRPWQVWPIPCSLGAMAGYVSSHLLMIRRLGPIAR